jgi:hypothetical protein
LSLQTTSPWALSALVLISHHLQVLKTEKLRIAADLTLLCDLRERVEVFKGRFRMTAELKCASACLRGGVLVLLRAEPGHGAVAFRWK